MSTSGSEARWRPPYHHGSLRPALLAEAVRVLADHGAAELSLRELARRLGVSHAAPYRHFADKDALLGALAQQGFELLAVDLEQAAAAHPDDALRQLLEIGWVYVRFALRQPQHFQVMFGVREIPQTDYPELLTAGQRAFGVLLGVIEAGQRAGQVAPGDSRELAVAAWTQVHGLATLLSAKQLPAADEQASEALVRRCLQVQHTGLAVDETRRRGLCHG
jgi:AcrR family transcriptional regulator